MSTPGFVDQGQVVHVTGGFRAHKHVPIIDDYYDGTFSAALYLSVVDGRFAPRIENFNIQWNRGLGAKLARWITAGISELLIDTVVKGFEEEAETKANAAFVFIHGFYLKAKENQEVFSRLADRTRLTTRGTSIVFAIDTANPLNPGVLFPPSFKPREGVVEVDQSLVTPTFNEDIDVVADCEPVRLGHPTFSGSTVDLGSRFLRGTGRGLFEVSGTVDRSGRLKIESIVQGLGIGFGSEQAVLAAIDATEFRPSDAGCRVRLIYEIE